MRLRYTSIAIICLSLAMLVGELHSEVKLPISQKLKFQLQQETTWEISNAPLSTLLLFLEKQHRLKFELDEVEMQKHNISPRIIVSFPSKGVFAEQLTILLQPHDLKWVATGDKIFIKVQDISSREKQESNATPQLKNKLSSNWKYDYQQIALEQLLEELFKTHQILVFIDSHSLKSAGVSADVAIQGTSLTSVRHGLNHLLKPVGLTWIAKGDRILIRAAKQR